jgi:hypothetical protein
MYITAIYAKPGNEAGKQMVMSVPDVPNGRGCADGYGGAQRWRGAGGSASGPKDLGRRLGRRHRSRGVDAWQPLVLRWQCLGRRLGRRHSTSLDLTAVRRSAGPTLTVPTATVPTASFDRRAGVCADGKGWADGEPVCAEAILCRRRCADGGRRHRRGPTAGDAVPTAAGRRPLRWFP